jgi:Holliday junction resolvase RusA-like endonuclease
MMLENPLEFTIELPPVTKKNHSQIIDMGARCPRCRRGKISKVIPAEKFRQYQDNCGYLLGKVRGLNINNPVNIKALYYIKADLKSDLTNYHSALHDMLVHYSVIEDDNRRIIVSTDGSRVFVDRKNPRTEVYITPIDAAEYQTEMKMMEDW